MRYRFRQRCARYAAKTVVTFRCSPSLRAFLVREADACQGTLSATAAALLEDYAAGRVVVRR